MKQFFTIILSLIIYTADSQSITLDPVKRADKYFQEFSYSKAVKLYKELLTEDGTDQSYVTNQIALSYRNLNMPDSSEVWFKKTFNLSTEQSINAFYLGEALMANGKYEEAKYWFLAYEKTAPSDNRVGKKLEAIADLKQFNSPLFDAKIERADFNSPGLDFSPAFYKNEIVFVSSRPKKGWIRQEFNWDQSRFLDIYVATDSATAQYLSEGLNTPYHEGPLVFFNNEKSVVYTRNNSDGRRLNRDNEGVTNLKMYFAHWNEETQKWDNETPFQHNNEAYSVGSPAISKNGKVLVFSSNQPGGYGESDLYISFLQGDTWTKPENLGEEINTKGRDGFPFLTNDQLFFASDGREGLGGLDIYSVIFSDGKTLGVPKNIGKPFNSNGDDFGLIIKENKGYFTSNRQKETSDDIYKVSVKEPQYMVVKGEVFDKETESGILKSDVFFKNEKGEFLYTRSKENGVYQLLAPINSSWNVYAGKYQYELVNDIDVNLSEKDTIVLDRIYLKKTISNPDTFNLPDATPIVDNRIKPYDETSHFVDGFGNGDTLKFDIVYFDLDKSNLRERSKMILNKASNFMIEHVDVKLILTSHTDSRASKAYNDALSRRRSNAVEKYLIEMGVNKERLDKQNLGENRLTNECSDGTTCSEDQHQNNRRTEISFVKKDI